MLRTVKMITQILLHKYQILTRENLNKPLSDSDQKSNEDNEIDLDLDNEDI